MSLIVNAELILTPNGFNTSKLYAIKPFDGSGDATVVRATPATRVNSSGLIEEMGANVPRIDYSNDSCPIILVEEQSTNLVLHSQEFDNTWWKKNTSTVTGDTTVAPDGTTTADTFSFGGNNLARVFRNTVSTPNSLGSTFSIWLKGTAGEQVTIEISGGSNSVTLTSDWVRYEVTDNVGATSKNIKVINRTANGDNATTLYAWGAQVEEKTSATSYIETTTSTVTRNADVMTISGLSGSGTLTETFEDNSTNVVSNPTSHTISEGRIKSIIMQ